MLQNKVLILELLAEYALPASAIVVSEVSSLTHEPGDNAVELAPPVSKTAKLNQYNKAYYAILKVNLQYLKVNLTRILGIKCSVSYEFLKTKPTLFHVSRVRGS